VDLLEHAAGVWARRYLVLGIALLVAAGVYAWRSAEPEQYVATTQLQVRLPDVQSDPGSQVEFYAGTVAGLVDSRPVVDDALAAAGRDDDVDDAAELLSAEVSEAGFVEVSAYGDSAVEAVELADSLAAALVEQVAAEQADDLAEQRAAVTAAIAELGRDRADTFAAGADSFERAALDREREALLGSLRTLAERAPWTLAVVEPAAPPTAPAAPTPLRDALLALILALILAAEGVVVARAVRGSLSARDPAADAGGIAGVPGLLVRPDRGAAALTPLLPAVGSARSVSVVQVGGAPRAHTAGMLAELLAVRGDDVLLVDANPARPAVHAAYDVALAPGLAELRRLDGDPTSRLESLPRVRHVHVLAAGAATVSDGPDGPDGTDGTDGAGDTGRPLTEIAKTAPQARVTVAASIEEIDDLIALVGDLDGPTVLDVDATTTKRQLRTDVETLRGLGLDLVAVTVSSGGREPRRERRQPPADAPALQR
jgi:hypothetical protein